MYKKILRAQNLSLKDRLKNFVLYYSRRKGAVKSWEKRYDKVFEHNKNLKDKQNLKNERNHHNKWSIFGKINPDTFRVCVTLSGKSNPNLIPEEIFVSDIEPTLNNNCFVNYISNKSFYNKWFSGGLFPKDYFHLIEGQYYDSHYNKLSESEFLEKVPSLNYPVIVKPNKDSFGGKGVKVIENADQVFIYCKQNKNVVIQEFIRQNRFSEKFNSGSINTVRVYLYKSVTDNEWKFLVAAFRMGKDGSMDNETSGGIFSTIKPNGELAGYAIDKYCHKYHQHPNTGLKFSDAIPDYEQLIKNSISIAEQIYLIRIVGLDMCYDENQVWRVIEVNTTGHTIRFAQYSGQPFFGEYTDDVIEYCKLNHWALRKN